VVTWHTKYGRGSKNLKEHESNKQSKLWCPPDFRSQKRRFWDFFSNRLVVKFLPLKTLVQLHHFGMQRKRFLVKVEIGRVHKATHLEQPNTVQVPALWNNFVLLWPWSSNDHHPEGCRCLKKTNWFQQQRKDRHYGIKITYTERESLAVMLSVEKFEYSIYLGGILWLKLTTHQKNRFLRKTLQKHQLYYIDLLRCMKFYIEVRYTQGKTIPVADA